jgi:uncharacterized membrane protein YgdD (TMEM256/DUF423 family)
MCTSKCWATIGAILAGLSVAAGAFGAHGLDGYFRETHKDQIYEKKAMIAGSEQVLVHMPLAEKYLADFKTGAEYQMYHGLALLAVGILSLVRPSRGLNVAGCCFVLGTFGFSGGLYAYTLTGIKWFGMIVVPSGGVLFLVGWTALAVALAGKPTACKMGETLKSTQHS